MEYKNILIIKMSSLGDILHALPFAAALRERFPQAKISWLVHPQFAGFIPEAPYIDEVLYFDKAAMKRMSWGERWRYLQKIRQELRKKKFDLVVDLQGLLKSGLMAFFTNCPTKIGYGEMREGSGLVSKAIVGKHINDHVIERYLDVARYLGAKVEKVNFPLPSLAEAEEKIRTKLSASGLAKPLDIKSRLGANGLYRYVVLVPGARWETKAWPVEYFAQVAAQMLRQGYYVVLAGGKNEATLGQQITNLLAKPSGLVNLMGQTDLKELAVLIKNCAFYLSGDTGPLHMASAYGKPLVALYGPTKPERTGPYGNSSATVVVAQMPCAGCLKKHCDKWECMHSITPDQVMKLFQEKMEAGYGGFRQ